MNPAMLKGHLDPLLLAILEAGPSYGYAIIDELRNRSDGTFDLPEGTVYPALHRLERERYVESGRAEVGKRVRRVYRLTRRGQRALADRREDWSRFSSAIDMVLSVRPA